jgi:hypothetical protein
MTQIMVSSTVRPAMTSRALRTAGRYTLGPARLRPPQT